MKTTPAAQSPDRRHWQCALLYATLVCAFSGNLHAQTPQNRLAFEVASVRPNLEDQSDTDLIPRRSGDRVAMHNSTLVSILAWAYNVSNPNYQIVSGRWHYNLWDCYDIDALAPASTPDDQLRLMFRTLLEDRLGLRVHWEKRTMAAYDLVLARNGPALATAPPRSEKPGFGYGGISSWVELTDSGPHLVGKSAVIDELVVILTREVHAPVRNRTGLAGMFDFDVAFSRGTDGLEKPVITTAIHELGLTLEKSRGTFDILVMDRLEKLSPN